MIMKLGHARDYRVQKNKLITGHFGPMEKSLYKQLDECFMNLILWWWKYEQCPEDVSLDEYLELPKAYQEILLVCLKTPVEYRVHYKFANFHTKQI